MDSVRKRWICRHAESFRACDRTTVEVFGVEIIKRDEKQGAEGLPRKQPCFCYSIKWFVDVFSYIAIEGRNGNERE